MLEKVVEAIDAELGRQEMVLTDPLTLRRMMATRAARAALEAMREPSALMVRAASESDATDGEGGAFGPLHDLLDFSGENKTRLVVAEALRKSIDAILTGEA